MTFHARHQVEVLLDGLDILRLQETEQDGHAFSGPKHWHTFDILARQPISKHPSAPASRQLSAEVPKSAADTAEVSREGTAA
jgi:hypothetical protein